MKLTAVVERRLQDDQRNVMVVRADRVVGMHDHMADEMIGGRWCTEARERAVRIGRCVVLTDAHRVSAIGKVKYI